MADAADSAVDRAISHLQSALDALKAAQGKDTDVDEPEPKTLADANRKARGMFAKSRSY